MLVHRMVKKVKDSKVLAKIGDSRGYKVTDQIIKGFMIYKSGTNLFTAKNENGEQYEGTMAEIKKQIDDYWMKQDEDVMKQKVRDALMECMECGKKFNKNLTSSSSEVKCPKCGGYDVEVASGDSKIKVKDCIKAKFNFKKMKDAGQQFNSLEAWQQQAKKMKDIAIERIQELSDSNIVNLIRQFQKAKISTNQSKEFRELLAEASRRGLNTWKIGDSKTKDYYTKNRNMRFKIKGDKLPVGLKKKVKDVLKEGSSQASKEVGTNDADDKSFDIRNIEKETIENDNFRKVIFTGNNLQLVLMSLLPNEDIGMEVHPNVDQFFRIDEGNGQLDIKGEGKSAIENGTSIVVKAGTYHNIIAGDKGLKLYTVYAPPNYPPDRVQKTKAEAMAAEAKG